MSSPRPDVSSARRALWLGGLLLTLAGLFGMHGLASHGTAEMGDEHSGHPAMAAMSTTAGSAAAGSSTAESSGVSEAGSMDAAAAENAATSAATSAATVTATAKVMVSAATALSDPAGGMGMDMGGAAMCLAVLLLTALALLVVATLRGGTPVVFLRPRPVRAPVTRIRDPRPPDLYALSILRC